MIISSAENKVDNIFNISKKYRIDCEILGKVKGEFIKINEEINLPLNLAYKNYYNALEDVLK